MIVLYREIKNCFRSLFIHRLRAFLSTLGIVFGVVAVITMLAIGEGAKQEVLEQIQQLGTHHLIVRQPVLTQEQRAQALERKSYGLNWKDVEGLKHNIPNLQHIAPVKIVEATPTDALSLFSPEILAVDASFKEVRNLQLLEGRFFCCLDQQNRNLTCVLGYEVAKHLGQKGHVGNSLKIGNFYYEIVGVLQPTHWKASQSQAITTRHLDRTLFIYLNSERDLSLSEMILQVRDDQEIDMTTKLAKHLLSRLHGGHEDYQIIIPQALLQQARRTQQTFNLVLGGIAALSLLVGGIGIMNIMLATVSERKHEIGIRRAVGANKGHIIRQFLLETLLLTLLGALIGILVGISLSFAISFAADWKMIVTLWSLLLSLGMSSIVGLCSGLYPALQAASMDPIQALRHN